MPHWFRERRRSRAPHRADVIHVVGLGPDDERFLTADALEHLTRLPARLRTRRHPAAAGFGHLDSYDEWYDEAEDFESLYRDIVADVVAWHDATDSDVTYGVPGSPLVAEHTVELLLASGVPIKIHPAVSVIDVVISALGVDPMTQRVRILDALDMPTLDGPGPWLILQVYSPELPHWWRTPCHETRRSPCAGTPVPPTSPSPSSMSMDLASWTARTISPACG